MTTLDRQRLWYYDLNRLVIPAMRVICVKVPESLDRQLTELSRRHKTTRSDVLRKALEAFGNRGASSVSARAADLAGSLTGPRDLSTSPKHMAGYGR